MRKSTAGYCCFHDIFLHNLGLSGRCAFTLIFAVSLPLLVSPTRPSIHYGRQNLRTPGLADKRTMGKRTKSRVFDFALGIVRVGIWLEHCWNEVVPSQLQNTEIVGCRVRSWIQEW